MTNFEYTKNLHALDEIINNAIKNALVDAIAVTKDTNEIKECKFVTNCNNCIFYEDGYCRPKATYEWLEQEYTPSIPYPIGTIVEVTVNRQTFLRYYSGKGDNNEDWYVENKNNIGLKNRGYTYKNAVIKKVGE